MRSTSVERIQTIYVLYWEIKQNHTLWLAVDGPKNFSLRRSRKNVPQIFAFLFVRPVKLDRSVVRQDVQIILGKSVEIGHVLISFDWQKMRT